MSKGLADLSDHLFAQMARLDDPNLKPEEIETEAKRAAVMVSVSDQIIGGAKMQIDAAKLFATHGAAVLPHLPQIGRQARTDLQIEKTKP
ncbi:hypothetical protein [Pseudorhodobacter sp.]|uniref:hypothetical protein n=1 Tax=Pseudorhodobacter sp. TaxID=1934400 RepID=UPI0026475935|nr:hypothetical protein [Pseudorhodobacter sp.]MDN5786521.1 hypothetical protein [Pseudorhodobacter sp.]